MQPYEIDDFWLFWRPRARGSTWMADDV